MKEITESLINWFLKNKRDLPFRKEKNAYHILLSEIIMQQTRVEQGVPYFLKISDAFPTVHHLAASNEELLLRHWQGLGYYSRARNLHATAKNIVENYAGKVPEAFEELRKLKGVGDYTAAAIASIAFGEPIPVIDGNVLRVISRLFAIDTPINNSAGKNQVKQCLESIFSHEQPGDFNEAIMEFGALQCVPSNPDCEKCPLKSYCKAFEFSKVVDLPVKTPAKAVKIRYLNYLFLLINEKYTVMRQRSGNDIWKNLYEFPLIETENIIFEKQLHQTDFWKSLNLFQKETKPIFLKTEKQQHKLTHRLLKATITMVQLHSTEDLILPNGFTMMTLAEADEKPKPILLANFLKS